MAKKIDSKTLSYFPTLGKSAKWEDAWTLLNEKGYELGIYDKMVGEDRPRKQVLEISLYYTDGTNESIVNTFEFAGEDRLEYVSGPGEFDEDAIYKLVVNHLIQRKAIKKPRNGKAIQQAQENELEELKKERQRLSMKISAWNRTGRDASSLEAQRVEINKKIKALR